MTLLIHLILQGECEHIGVKAYYDRTNKNEYVEQLATHKQREALIHGIREELDRQQELEAEATAEKERQDETERKRAQGDPKGKARAVEPESSSESDDEGMPSPSPSARYTMGKSRKDPVRMYDWLGVHAGDPAITVCSKLIDCCVKSTHY